MMELYTKQKDKIQILKGYLETLDKEPAHANYCLIDSKIKQLQLRPEDFPQEVKIALLSNFTWEPFDLYLRMDCLRADVFPQIYIGKFNQYRQEILDLKSGFHPFGAEVVILAFYGKEFFKEGSNVEEKIHELSQLLEMLANKFPLVIVQNFSKPYRAPLGILDIKLENGTTALWSKANASLIQTAGKYENVHIMDFEGFINRYGEINCFDERMWYLAKRPLRREIWRPLSREYMRFVKPLKRLTKKCLVLDLDNTLWGGILGEEGLEGIKLGPGDEGEAFQDFQREILGLTKKGILLTINSKNEEEEVWEVFEKHPHMILKKENFVAWRINWNDKASNLKSIAEQLNLGLDSFVYMDDDPVEIEWVKENLPEVLTVPLPAEPADYSKTLNDLDCFEKLFITEEDRERTVMYLADFQRKTLKTKAPSLEEFYQNLEMTAVIKEVDDFSMPRVVQLLARTNQFNMTAKRYSEKEIKNMAQDKNWQILTFQLKDRFGDSGIVGLAIIKKEAENWWVDSFLLSCRVLGRNLENDFLAFVVEKAKGERVKELRAQFVLSKKNSIAKDFYKNNRFWEVSSGNTSEWLLEVENSELEVSSWLKIEEA